MSDWDEEAQWETEEILLEADFDVEQEDGTIRTERQFLVKWKGYSRYKSTWEPRENLVNADLTLWRWDEYKMRRRREGKDPEFDDEQWEQEKADIEAKRMRRQKRRNKKRRQLGLEEKHYAEPDDEADDESGSRRVSGSVINENTSVSSRGQESRMQSAAGSDKDEHVRMPTKKRKLEAPFNTNALKRGKGRAVPVRADSDHGKPKKSQTGDKQPTAVEKRTSSIGAAGWSGSRRKPPNQVAKEILSGISTKPVQPTPQAKTVPPSGPARKVGPSKPSLQPGMLTSIYRIKCQPPSVLTEETSQTCCRQCEYILQFLQGL